MVNVTLFRLVVYILNGVLVFWTPQWVAVNGGNFPLSYLGVYLLLEVLVSVRHEIQILLHV